MQNFVYTMPTRVVFGTGAIESAGEEAARLGRHALVVTGTAFARRSGLIDTLRSSLDAAGVRVTLFDELSPNPRVGAIDDGGNLARRASTDFVLGLGGGSVMDAAKAIAAAARTESSIWAFARHDTNGAAEDIAQALPVMQIPIVASTGSETSDTAVVLDETSRTKAWLRSPFLFARVAVVDPTLTFTVPPAYTAVGGMNIVSQMLESYLTSDEFSVTDRVTEGLMRVVMDSLPRAMRRGEDLEARTNLSWVSAFAPSMTAANRGGTAPLRAMAQPLSAYFPIDYGAALAALWPSYMRYALSNRYRLPQIGRFKRYALLGRQIFGVQETDDEVAAETTTYRLAQWLRTMEMPTDLLQLGVDLDNLRPLADQAVVVSGNGKRLPGGLSVEDVENIYEGALRPRS
ncbi:MAG: iron-containing alcohol dehydrogenase [Chloroflexota bacterium]